MAPPISDDLKSRIVQWYFIHKHTEAWIAQHAQVSIGLVSKVVNNYRRYGAVNNPTVLPRGRPSTLDDGDLQYIRALLEMKGTGYLDELQAKLRTVRHVHVSLATLSRTLRKLGLSRKKVNRVASERDEELRKLWEVEMAEYTDPNLFVFLDESAVDNHTAQRRYGWSDIGTPCVERSMLLRGVRYSVLPALWRGGILGLDIIEGSVTKDIFLGFLREQVAPKLNPYPGERSIVIMDNCTIHHDEDIRALIEDECGARLIYLPPYSPDFNPIEEAFSAIKAWLRRNESKLTGPEQLPWLIHQAALSVTEEDILGWFKDCGY